MLVRSSIDLAENSLHSANLCGPLHSIHTALFGLLCVFSVDAAPALDGGVVVVAGTGDVTGMDVVSIVGDERLSFLPDPGRPCFRSPVGLIVHLPCLITICACTNLCNHGSKSSMVSTSGYLSTILSPHRL